MTSERVAGPTGALAVDDGGRGGMPVLLVHSLAGTLNHWSAQLRHLRASRRAVAFDLRGHGRSESPRNHDYALDSAADDVGAVVDALGLQRFALVGHSMGAGVALAYAGKHPDRVARLLLADAIGDGTQLEAAAVEPLLAALRTSDYAAAIEGYWATISGPDVAIRDRLLSDLRATPRETVVEGMHQVTRYDPKPALASYRGPTLAVITPLNSEPSSLHRLGTGLSHVMMKGTGHWLQLDRPEEFNRILDRFLQEEL